MDPRPYHFQYRKPRLNNRTYLSYGASDSIYNIGAHSKQATDDRFKRFFLKNPQVIQSKKTPMSQPVRQPLSRNRSFDFQNMKKISVDANSYKNDRYNSKGKQEVTRGKISSNLSNYGNNLVKMPIMDQQRVYAKQQKNYNIISFYPNEHISKLKEHPKLTLQNKLMNRSAIIGESQTER